MPTVSTIPAPSAITWVQLTCSLTTVNPPLSVGSVIDRACAAAGWPEQVHRAEQHQGQAERGHGMDQRVSRGQAGPKICP